MSTEADSASVTGYVYTGPAIRPSGPNQFIQSPLDTPIVQPTDQSNHDSTNQSPTQLNVAESLLSLRARSLRDSITQSNCQNTHTPTSHSNGQTFNQANSQPVKQSLFRTYHRADRTQTNKSISASAHHHSHNLLTPAFVEGPFSLHFDMSPLTQMPVVCSITDQPARSTTTPLFCYT
jgi:hypothetical protein